MARKPRGAEAHVAEELQQELSAAKERIAALEEELAAAKELSRLEIERLESLYHNAPLGYQSLDERGDFIEVN